MYKKKVYINGVMHKYSTDKQMAKQVEKLNNRLTQGKAAKLQLKQEQTSADTSTYVATLNITGCGQVVLPAHKVRAHLAVIENAGVMGAWVQRLAVYGVRGNTVTTTLQTATVTPHPMPPYLQAMGIFTLAQMQARTAKGWQRV